MNDGDVIAVWFSCGAASAVAAKKTIETYPNATVRIVYNPVKEEHIDNLRFLADVETWLGKKIEIATNPKYPSCSAVEVWGKRKYMAGVKGAPCTYELKKRARQIWEESNHVDWHVLGFTAEERRRADRFIMGERENMIPILIELGITKPRCFYILEEAGLTPPAIYRMGYPNANCIGCVKVTSPTYWNLVRQTHPETFSERCVQSRAIGCKLVEVGATRIFLDELSPSTNGGPLKNIDFECGIFCEPERIEQ